MGNLFLTNPAYGRKGEKYGFLKIFSHLIEKNKWTLQVKLVNTKRYLN